MKYVHSFIYLFIFLTHTQAHERNSILSAQPTAVAQMDSFNEDNSMKIVLGMRILLLHAQLKSLNNDSKSAINLNGERLLQYYLISNKRNLNS